MVNMVVVNSWVETKITAQSGRKKFQNEIHYTSNAVQSQSCSNYVYDCTYSTSQTQAGCITLMPHYYHEEPAQRNSANRPRGVTHGFLREIR